MWKTKKITDHTNHSLKAIQKQFFRTQLVLIVSLAVILGIAGTMINIHFETEKRDQNLQNTAQTIARSPLLLDYDMLSSEDNVVVGYLNTLRDTLDDIDVISIVNKDNIRIYHSNSSLIGSEYDGNLPDFVPQQRTYYTVDEEGPSGSQRRAYAAVYDENGHYAGFVMAIMLMKNIKLETVQLLTMFFVITFVAILIELIIANQLSRRVKDSLLGYEPDVFTAMYKMRNNILETLEEGILAIDQNYVIQYANESAAHMLVGNTNLPLTGLQIDELGNPVLSNIIKNGDRESNISLTDDNILLDRVPIMEDDCYIGAVAILHDRAEYTKLMEDLSGTRYLVDSMRANNHDFTNKLHVILGLIQMEMYDEATSYIQNISMVQRENISKIMKAVNDPSVAALLIGKISRASELNVEFVLREGCRYMPADMNLPSSVLTTVIGNLLDNSFEAMNTTYEITEQKSLLFGIYSKPGAVLITVDDTGHGICEDDLPHVFDNGYSTKGEGRGTGLYQVKSLVESYGGRITVESQKGDGTSFAVSFTDSERMEE